MKLMFIFVGVFLFNTIKCHESGSFESYNGIELSPFYDTIIFSDIADIMKEFESSSIPLFDRLARDESDSDENVEDLLQEYQTYLEKEHKQRKDYIERTKLKNKVPLLRHERFSKKSFGNGGKYNDYLYKNGYYNIDKSKNPLDLFIPIHPNINQFNTMELTTTLPRDSMELSTFNKIIQSESGSSSSFSKFPFKVPCCKNGQTSCKQCMTAKDQSRNRLEPRTNMYSDEKKHATENRFAELTDSDDALNIRIKIDVQLPKIQDKLDKHQYAFGLDDRSNPKNFPLPIQMPTSYYNYPIPMNLFGYKRISKLNSSPLHKLSIHKKKKAKPSTSGKKHRKKIITFHNIKLEPQQLYEAHFGKATASEGTPMENQSIKTPDLIPSTTEILKTNLSSTTTAPLNKTYNENQTEESIFLLVNISNNDTEGINKTNNSIETEYSNNTTKMTLHFMKKRDVANNNNTVAIVNKTIIVEKAASKLNKTVPQEKHNSDVSKALKESVKKGDKSLPSEEELLYWPNNNKSIQSKVVSKNITTIILEGETKKGKLNISNETMRKNHTRVLEKAIFGDVDWKDVDTVAPAFMSFIGKYIEGTLTFCSDVICHSMKCGQKVCHHRVCAPEDRFNNKGHCMGSNDTDSVATMESIMDLPSKVVFEIVDILQDKMSGKLFGKMTLCISNKCISFASSKKLFIKYRCIAKELNPKGHCLNSKGGKTI